MRWIIPFLLVLPLAACFEDQGAKLAGCELQTGNAGIDPTKSFGGITSDDGYRRVTLCMKAAGYDLEVLTNMCMAATPAGSIYDGKRWLSVYCYEPSSPLAKLLYYIEMKWRAPKETFNGNP